MRVPLRLCLFLAVSCLRAAPPAQAQTDVGAAGRATPVSAPDLSGHDVSDGARRAVGDYAGLAPSPTGPPLDGTVNAVAVGADGVEYAGGAFTAAGGTVLNRVARRVGGAWQPLGGGVNGAVRALAVAPDGTLYAGGDFTEAGGVPASRVARWTGSAWEPLGAGVDDAVYSLSVAPDGSLLASGFFLNAGGVLANRIARWTGTAWEPLGGGLDNWGLAVAAHPDGSVYVGGVFRFVGGVEIPNLARWDGSAWAAVGGGINGTVRAFDVADDGALLVGGEFTLVGTTPPGGLLARNIARWTGTAWTTFGPNDGTNGTTGAVAAISAGPGGAFWIGGAISTVGGQTASRNRSVNVAQWTGAGWAIPPPPGAAVLALAHAPDGQLVAGGLFETVDETVSRYAARWTGTAWQALGAPEGANGAVNAAALGADGTLYVGGAFTQIGGIVANRVARRVGGVWQPLAAVYGGQYVNGVTGAVNALLAMPDGTLYAGGDFTEAGGATAGRIARWTGTAWEPLGTGSANGINIVRGSAVNAFALAPDGSLYVGGNFTAAGGAAARYLARWTGSAWEAVGTTTANGIGNGPVFALALAPDGSLVVGGSFTSVGGVASTARVVRRRGTVWESVGAGITLGQVNALAMAPDGSVVAGGTFTTVGGGAAANRVARWAGAAWEPLGTGAANGVAGGAVSAVRLAPDGSVVVGGLFTSAGGSAALPYLARWSGTAWEGLGAGVGGAVRAVVEDRRGDLVVGGDFATAGAAATSRLALFDAPVRAGIAGPAAYHMLAAPAMGLALDGVLGPLWTQGYPGADSPNGNASVYGYTEATPGNANAGYAAPGSQGDAWASGTGRFVFVYEDDNYATPAIDGGFPKRLTFATATPVDGPFTFPVSYTDDPAASAGDDGWNLLGNPFATAMDWDGVTVGAGLDAAVYAYDASYLGGSYRTYVGGVGSVTNGVLAPMQGFWVHATAAGAALTAPLASQAPTAGGPVFRGVAEASAGVLRFEVREGGAAGAEAFVSVSPQGTLGLDALDAYALAPPRADYLTLATIPAEGFEAARLSIQSVPSVLPGETALGLSAGAVGGAQGARSLEVAWDAARLPAGWSARLVDTATNESRSLSAAGVYAFETTAGAAREAEAVPAAMLARGGAARFRVVLSPNAVATEDGAVAALALAVGPNPASRVATAFVTAPAGPATVAVYDALGRRVAQVDMVGTGGRAGVALPVSGLATGVYVVRLTSGAEVRTVRLVVAR